MNGFASLWSTASRIPSSTGKGGISTLLSVLVEHFLWGIAAGCRWSDGLLPAVSHFSWRLFLSQCRCMLLQAKSEIAVEVLGSGSKSYGSCFALISYKGVCVWDYSHWSRLIYFARWVYFFLGERPGACPADRCFAYPVSFTGMPHNLHEKQPTTQNWNKKIILIFY